ncbi:MAG: hypothetical protein LH614_11840 [Pyrinomonadaceae bacterium]|nr:hypothetical protein [Pyrinomonadaceae bacterium]
MRRIILIGLTFAFLTVPVVAQKLPKSSTRKSANAPNRLTQANRIPTAKKVLNVSGEVYRYENFPTEISRSRNIDVWLPPGYNANTGERCAVLYMHDGQNLFSPADAGSGVEWGIDETLTRLISEQKVRRTIVVGIWNTAYRFTEYAPQKAADLVTRRNIKPSPLVKTPEGESDKYLRFIVSELKPFIDKNYRTKPDANNTFVIGSSMGGLISLYAVSEYPNIFGGAGSLSTQFPLGDGIIIGYLKKFLPAPKNHKIYFDFGTEGLDANYEPFQKQADNVMKSKGYKRNKNWLTRKFEGADHSEKSWAQRVAVPLEFLLKN